MRDGVNPDPKPDDFENEFVWALRPLIRKLALLLSCWTTDLNVQTFTKEDGVKARALALFLIAALTFAVRSEDAGDHHTAVFTAFAGGIAIILSVVLNLISRWFKIPVREQLVMSAYVSTIIVMLFFVIVEIVLVNMFPVGYQDIFDIWNGAVVVVPAVAAGFITFAILLLKSKWRDRHIIEPRAITHAITLTGGSTIIVIVVALMKPEVFLWFQWVAEWIDNFRSQ
jgi:hypothetical protein